MKNYKKIGLGILFSLAGLFCLGSAALAAGGPINGSGEWRQATYSMNKASQIIVNLAGNDHDNIIFTDSNPNDSTFVYTADTNNTGVCDGTIKFNKGQTLSSHPVIATIQVDFENSESAPTCTAGAHNGANDAYSNSSISITNNTTDGGKKAADTGPATISYNGATYKQVNTGAGVTAYGANGTIGSDCYGGSLIILNKVDSAANAPVSATLLPISLASAGTELSSQVSNFPSIPLSVASVGKCYYNSSANSGDNVLLSVKADGTATFTGCSKGGTACKGDPGSSGAAGTAAQGSACEANSGGWSFTWIACPVLDAANGLTTLLVNIFEDQLSFSVSQLGSGTDPTSGNYKIHQSWSIVKDIASALIVIIMLIMVLSQAVSFGPFDAYTIRKLLPRLIAAVILMQISWPLFTWVIELVNDIARGIADILYLPFGGSGNMDLWHLLYNAKLSNGLLAAMNWGALLLFGVLAVAFLFTMMGMAFVAITALFFGVVTLIFRKILIILLLIFAPIALLAWILPGTERYWKMWRDNFMKVLFMFPIIVGIIAAGRIFAYVVGTQDNGQFLNLIFIMVGFFGPLFILPKTYKWGGQAMQMAGNGIMKAGSKVSEGPKKYFDKRQEEYNAQKAVSRAERLREWDRGNLSTRGKVMSALRGDKFKAGDWDPAYMVGKARIPLPGGRRLSVLPGGQEMRRQQETKVQQSRAASIRHENEEREFAKQRLEEEAAHASPGNRDGYYRKVWLSGLNEADYAHDPRMQADIRSARSEIGHRNEAERFAALEMAALEGGEGGLEFLQTAADTAYNKMYETVVDPITGNATTRQRAGVSAHDVEENAAMDKLLGRNTAAFFAKMPHLPYYKGVIRAAEGLKPEDITTLSERGAIRILDELQRIIASPAAEDVARHADARVALQRFYDAYQLAASSDTTNRRISFGVRDAVVRSMNTAPVASTVREAVLSATSKIQSGEGYSPSPGELRVQHEEAIIRNLPPETIVAPAGSPDRETFKIQLKTDPSAFDTLANGIASGAVPLGSEYFNVLGELKSEAVAAGTAEAVASWNQKVAQLQQAYQKSLDQTVASAVASGVDPAVARATALSIADPATGRTISEEISSLEATPPGGIPPNPLNKL